MTLLSRAVSRVERRTWAGGGGFAGAVWGDHGDGTVPPPWAGGRDGGAPRGVSQETALRLVPVWSCVRLVADYIAGLPVSSVRPDGNGGLIDLGMPALLRQPWPEMTQFEWFFAMQASLMLRGNAYGLKHDLDRHGYPRMIQPLNPDKVIPRRVDGSLVYYVDRIAYPAEAVFHVRNFITAGDDVGLSPIAAFARTIGMQLAAEEFGDQFFADGAHPTSVLESEQPITEKQAKTIKRRILMALAGNREPLVIGSGAKWRAIQVAPNESQFLELMKFGVNQIARIFGVPAEIIGGSADGSAVTYANVESRDMTLQTYGVLPWTERWAQALTPCVPIADSVVRFDLDSRLRADRLTRSAADLNGIRGGWLCADDIRLRDGMDAIPDDAGKQFLWPPFANRFEMTEDNATVADDPAAAPPAAA